MPPLLFASCNGGDGQGNGEGPGTPSPTAGPWSGGIERPEGFPEDFPIYENAIVNAASRFGTAPAEIFAIGLETADGAGDVRSFYEETLAVAPWEVSNVVEIPEENTVIVEFVRRGDAQTGTVAIQEEQTNGRRTLIAVSLPAPPGAETPAPTASPAP